MTRSAAEVRSAFLDYFAGKEHKIVKSAPVVPPDDPTLLFTNAGMNQFKDVFLGTGTRDYSRCADTQKCIRVSGKHNDLEEVGYDTYHHTFFEMLGNWSFGDYFKAEAIAWAWELLTDWMGLPKDKLWATVFGGDDKVGLGADEEAEALWPEMSGIPAERVLRCGMKDNFWEMGETGPCGPCSEIHLDQGPAACDRQGVEGHVCQVNGDCSRYIEIWNLVFIQYNNTGGYNLKKLPANHVDTGMGFERLVAAVQGKVSNYDTDVFSPIFDRIGALTGHSYGSGGAVDVSFRVIADHVRALCSAIADGAMPDAKMRGSTLRSLLRRAARFGRQTLGMEEPFIHQLVPVIAEQLGTVFPEIAQRQEHISLVLEEEERSFGRTINRGLRRFASLARQTREQGSAVIDGHEAFRLFHQDGFPRDLIDQMAREESLAVDEEGWQAARTAHEEVSREGGVAGYRIDPAQLEGLPATEFVGYWERSSSQDKGTSATAQVLKVIDDSFLILDRTPFYASAGGQVGDRGEIYSDDFKFRVDDTIRLGDVTVHIGVLEAGDATAPPARVTARVSAAERDPTASNHTATHLLHWALKRVLGPGANQQGSYVGADRLRFDFNHPRQLAADELLEVERLVNDRVRQAVPLDIGEDSFEHARQRGVTALFGEKYGDRVRVVDIGGFSQELCGGTHVTNTGEIGLFKLVSEEGVAAGVRRIEAITGAAAVSHVQRTEQLLRQAAGLLKSSSEAVPERIETLRSREKDLQREVEDLKRKLAAGSAGSSGEEREVGGVAVFSYRAPFADARSLREVVDQHRNRLGSAVVMVGGADGDKVSLVVGVTDDLTGRFHAGNMVRELAAHVGGKGGGRPDFAQAGGRNPEGLDTALAGIFDLVASAK
jgi:alanyl-tRNA synthetase